MALPIQMGLCPDSKRGLNFYMCKKNPNTTMMDKGGCAVFSTSSPCSAPQFVNGKPSISRCLPTPSFHTRTFGTFLVGGFLGSKSQGRSTNSLQSVSEIIPSFFNIATECLQQCHFSSVPSPPKKKFAKGESIAYVDTIEFPVIEDKTCEESRVDGSKQSYAEVAKAVSNKPSRFESYKELKGLTESDSLKDNTKTGSRKDNTSRRRTDTGDHRNSRRKSNKRERGEKTPRRLFPGGSSSPSTEPQPEPLKDLRLCQQEKHFSQLQIAASNRNPKKSDRLCCSSTDTNRRDRLGSDHTEGKHRPKRRSNYRTHCDNKRGSRAKHFDCDIDKINWRTGEPISDKMGPQNDDVNGEDYLADRSHNNSFASEQTNEGCTGEQRKSEMMSETSRHDVPSASPRCRRRSLSECSVGSEDSFIVFQTGGADSLSDQGSDWSDCDSDDSFETDSEMSDEDDMCDGLYPSSRLNEVNEYWQREYSPIMDSSEIDSTRKVRFSGSQPIIHRMLAWDYAYRAARPGPWEQMGRDRDRFKTRIRQCEAILSPVLTSDHRKKLWNKLHSS